jgi:hypothetical protein
MYNMMNNNYILQKSIGKIKQIIAEHRCAVCYYIPPGALSLPSGNWLDALQISIAFYSKKLYI